MNVDGIRSGATRGVQHSHGDRHGHESGRMDQALSSVATLFGQTVDQLRTELRSGGASLTSLAASKGISKDDLVAAVKQGIQGTKGGANLSEDQLSAMATHLADKVQHGWHGARPHRAEHQSEHQGAPRGEVHTTAPAAASNVGIYL